MISPNRRWLGVLALPLFPTSGGSRRSAAFSRQREQENPSRQEVAAPIGVGWRARATCGGGGIVFLIVFLFPSAARSQAVSSEVSPKVEIAATVGVGSVMGDDSWRGAGHSIGGAIGTRIWRGAGVEFAVDRLRTQHDLSSGSYWRGDTTTLFTGTVFYRFSASHVQPFVEGALGAALIHSRHDPDPGSRWSGSRITTKAVWGLGAGLRIPAGTAFSISPGLKFFVSTDSVNPLTLWQGSVRVGYGWGGGSVPRVNERPAPKVVIQSLARSFQELSGRLTPGDVVYVFDEARRETRGLVSAVSASSLVLLVDGTTRELPEDSVVQIDRRGDRLKNGILTGLIIGAVTPAVIIFSMCQQGCHSSDLAAATTWSLGWGLIGGGIGAAAGAGIDAMRVGRTTVYVSPRKTSGVTISPLLGKDRQGALVSVRF